MKKQNNEQNGFSGSLKEQPTTLQEAKKRAKKLYIIMGAIFAVGVVFMTILLGFVVGIIGLLMLGGILLYFISFYNKKMKRNFCSSCGKRIDYDDEISWKIVKYDEKTYSPSDSNQRKPIKKRIAHVRFNCTCSNCGATKDFTEKWDAVIWYDDRTVEEFNIEERAENYFKL